MFSFYKLKKNGGKSQIPFFETGLALEDGLAYNGIPEYPKIQKLRLDWMKRIEYIRLQDVAPERMMALMNEDSLRTHLMEYPVFDVPAARQWMEEKTRIDETPGCRVRAVTVRGELAGWCGIQPDELGFELAIVISSKFWGTGLAIFKDLMSWAQELGHREVLFHLLDSRPAYRALEKMASRVTATEMEGRRFTTYYIPVNP